MVPHPPSLAAPLFRPFVFPTTRSVPSPIRCLTSKHADALKPLREAVAVLDRAIGRLSANEGGAGSRFEIPAQFSRGIRPMVGQWTARPPENRGKTSATSYNFFARSRVAVERFPTTSRAFLFCLPPASSTGLRCTLSSHEYSAAPATPGALHQLPRPQRAGKRPCSALLPGR